MPKLSEINPEISPRTERAVSWALSLHPEERPQSVDDFQSALLGDWDPSIRKRNHLPRPTLADVLTSPIERRLLWTALGLFLVSLIAQMG